MAPQKPMVLLSDIVPTVAKHSRGLVPGRRVCVLEGRNFANFSGGEVGKLLSIDLDSQRCLVHFKGRGPVEVPVRHLCAVETSQPEEEEVTRAARKDLDLEEPRPRRSRLRTPSANAEAAALKDMLAYAAPSSPRTVVQTLTPASPEGAWFTLCECSPQSSFCTPWKHGEAMADGISQTGSTRDSTSPIDTVWREAAASPKVAISARAWRLESSEVPVGAVGTKLLHSPPGQIHQMPQILQTPRMPMSGMSGLLPPGNLLGSISSLPTVPFSSPHSVNVCSSVSPFATI